MDVDVQGNKQENSGDGDESDWIKLTRKNKKNKKENYVKSSLECDFCKSSFAAESELKDHKETQTVKELFKCERCGKTFEIQSELKKHESSHNRINQSYCQKSDDRFVNESKSKCMQLDASHFN